jgi:predicted nucleic-acid-binding Zn-ribbon protein
MKEKAVDIAKFEELLTQMWKGKKTCPICNNNTWSVGEKLYSLREYHGSGFGIGDVEVYPLATVTCNVCGYTHLFNAIAAGVMNA